MDEVAGRTVEGSGSAGSGTGEEYSGTGSGSGEVVLIPVKSFATAKERLAPVLSAAQRAGLARKLADAVIACAAPLPVTVVCEDNEVMLWAVSHGASVVRHSGSGLNGAVQDAAWCLASSGVARITVAHADIPDASTLAKVGTSGGTGDVVLVPDLRRDGTNVLSLPATAVRAPGDAEGFVFTYGPGSFSRHCAEVFRLSLGMRVISHTALSVDIDKPADLVHVEEGRP